MIEATSSTHINKGCDSRLKTSNDTTLSECTTNILETAPSSPQTRHYPPRVGENLLKLANHAGEARRQRRAQSPAPNYNPHSARRTA